MMKSIIMIIVAIYLSNPVNPICKLFADEKPSPCTPKDVQGMVLNELKGSVGKARVVGISNVKVGTFSETRGQEPETSNVYYSFDEELLFPGESTPTKVSMVGTAKYRALDCALVDGNGVMVHPVELAL